jgi:hypothetical protein
VILRQAWSTSQQTEGRRERICTLETKNTKF